MSNILIKPEKITKKFLSVLPDRSFDVLARRFGLKDDLGRTTTLEAIGRDYGITRERIRQIENNAIKNIRKSEIFGKESKIFDDLYKIIDSLGGIVSEEDLLDYLAGKKRIKNHIHFLLVLGDLFYKEKEDNLFKSRWYINNEIANEVHSILDQISEGLTKDDLYPENEIVSLFLDRMSDFHTKYKKPEIVKRWLSLSKIVGRNHFNEWGLASSTNINAKGIRDYAYLSIRQHGNPMHFREVAKSIADNFDRKAHTATCHNELIKDSRFVLVGRGLYALTEWGYTGGVVKDVIRNILEEKGPLTRSEIIEKVLRERYIKENTVVVNLQDTKLFKKDNKGRYIIV